MFVFAFLFGALIVQSLQISTPSDAYYTAGVVEFRPETSGMTPSESLANHLAEYRKIISSPEANVADLIVFPEGTLNNYHELTYVPNPKDNVIPCVQSGKYHDFLVQISCSARSAKKYIVINITEKENCTAVPAEPRSCASTGINKFNTNVVFDRAGRVISRYRKVHVYVEDVNVTLVPEMGIFETDFGVTFGHFICFDIIFYAPAQKMAVDLGIRDFIFPNWWYSELPFLTAVQLQQSWSHGNDVNLLAAGASLPEIGSTGTGIFAGKEGALVSVMNTGVGERKLYVAKVYKKVPGDNVPTKTPLMQKQIRQTGVRLMRDYQIGNYKSHLVDFRVAGELNKELCDGNFCCSFRILAKDLTPANSSSSSCSYRYRIGILNGDRVYEKAEKSSLQICGIYACTNDTTASCGTVFPQTVNVSSDFVFEEIFIEGSFSKSQRFFLMPNSLDDSLYPLPVESIQWSIEDRGNHHHVRYSLTGYPSNNLLAFAIYANYYDRSIASSFTGCTGALLTTISLFTLVFRVHS